jgi:hypothetical protein
MLPGSEPLSFEGGISDREKHQIENTKLHCRSCIMYMLWFSIRGFTNILIPISTKARTVLGRVEGRLSVRSLAHISRFPQEPVKVLCARERPPPADTDLVSILERQGGTDDGWRLYPTGGHGDPFQRAR